MKNLSKIILVVSLICLYNTNAQAQNYNDALRLSLPGITTGARALGMGSAYTSLSNDFSGVQFNPAGLGLVRRMEVTGGLNSFSLQNSADFFNTTSDYTNSVTDLNQVGFIFPFPTSRGSFVLALGYNQRKNFNSALKFDAFNSDNNSMIQYLTGFGDISYLLFLTDSSGEITPINGMLNQRGNILESGNISTWSLAGALEVSENVFVGATLNLFSGKYESDRRYFEEDVNDVYGVDVQTDPEDPDTQDFELFYLNDFLEWDIAGWDLKLGFLYDMHGFFTVGATVKFPTVYDIKEIYNVYGEAEFGTNVLVVLDPEILNNDEYEITTPYEFTVGGSIDIANLIISADAKYIDYSQMEFSGGLSPADRSYNNREIKELFESVLNYNMGFEYELPLLNLLVRGGFMYINSPFKGDPSEFDRKFFTGGLGFNASRTLRVDIAYAHGWWKDIGDNYDSGVSRTFQDLTSDNVVFSVTYRLR